MLLFTKIFTEVQVMRKCFNCRTQETKWQSFFFTKPSFKFSRNGKYQITISKVPYYISNISLGFLTKDQIDKIIQKSEDRPHSIEYIIPLSNGYGNIIRTVSDVSLEWFVFFPKNYKYPGKINVICARFDFIFDLYKNHVLYFLITITSIFLFLYFHIRTLKKYIHNSYQISIAIMFIIISIFIFIYHFYSIFYSDNIYFLEVDLIIQWIYRVIELFIYLFVLNSLISKKFNLYIIAFIYKIIYLFFRIGISINTYDYFIPFNYIYLILIIYLMYKKEKEYYCKDKIQIKISKYNQFYLFGKLYIIIWTICLDFFDLMDIFSLIPDIILVFMFPLFINYKSIDDRISFSRLNTIIESKDEKNNINNDNNNICNSNLDNYISHNSSLDSNSFDTGGWSNSFDTGGWSNSCDMSDWSSSS